MRFFVSALAASLVATVFGATTGRAAEPVTTKETCGGLIHWSKDGFFRSGSTVRYHGHMWQCTRWNKGENPEASDIWKDLGECDPDMQAQLVLSKRSALNVRGDGDDDDDEHPYCHGYLNWDPKATFRSGTTVTYDGRLYQTSTWGSKAQPGESNEWKLIATCRTESKKVKRSECDGVPDYDDRALYRSGTEVEYKSELFQSNGWAKGVAPTDPHLWTHLGHCD